MNNDNEPPSLMQFWSHANAKLVINKSWPYVSYLHKTTDEITTYYTHVLYTCLFRACSKLPPMIGRSKEVTTAKDVC